MKRKTYILVLMLPAIGLFGGYALFSAFKKVDPSYKAIPSASAAATATKSCDCYSSPMYKMVVNFDNKVPGDLPSFNSQSKANCFAWQEFISMNWPLDPAGYFGKPMDYTPVTWETYMPKDVLFQPGGAEPSMWGTLVAPRYAAKFKTQGLLMTSTHTKLLTFTAKFADDTLKGTKGMGPDQAAPFRKPNWLGAQNKTNLWYEIMLNKDYYEFVKKKGYYNAITQHDSVKKGVPINFPQGVVGGQVGAVELKAAWMEVDNIQSPKWKTYKLSKAIVWDSTTGKLRETTVALVGLHILHKTQNQPTWVWATFEHIDNVPDGSGVAPQYGYNFHNKNCAAQQVRLNNGTTVTVGCTANVSPPYYLSQAAAVPIQLTRLNPIDPTDAKPINDSMRANIKKYYPESVFQYYELIDVIWSQQPMQDATSPIPAPFPLNTSSMLSGAGIVANVTMESYVQNTNTCYSCHMGSRIAPYPMDTVNNKIFSDFSFAIGLAQYPAPKKK